MNRLLTCRLPWPACAPRSMTSTWARARPASSRPRPSGAFRISGSTMATWCNWATAQHSGASGRPSPISPAPLPRALPATKNCPRACWRRAACRSPRAGWCTARSRRGRRGPGTARPGVVSPRTPTTAGGGGAKWVGAGGGEGAGTPGNGRSTVAELIESQINADPRRGYEEAYPLEVIDIATHEAVQLELRRQGLEGDGVPAAGRKIVVQRNGNVAIDCTDEVHPEVAYSA